MIRSIINKIKSTAQHKEPESLDPELALGFAVVPGPFEEDPVSLKLLVKFKAINFEPQLPQYMATSLFSWPQFGQNFDILYPLNKMIFKK